MQRVSQHLRYRALGVTTTGTPEMNPTAKKPWALPDHPRGDKECARGRRLNSFILDLSYLKLNPKT